VSENPNNIYAEELDDFAECSLPIADWLLPMPDRQVLVIDPNNDCMAGRVDRLVQKIGEHDLHTAADKAGVLSKPGLTHFQPTASWALPYDSGQFDLAICAFISTAADIKREMLCEIGRVINADGHLLIVDYLVPGSRLRGKKARQLRAAENYINTWMWLRNSQHKRCLGQDAWKQRLTDSQWDMQQMVTRKVLQDFDTWADCYSLTEKNHIRLRAMLVQAPEKAHAFLTPLNSGDRIAFRMIEVFILSTKKPV
jgi:hypothetical protein